MHPEGRGPRVPRGRLARRRRSTEDTTELDPVAQLQAWQDWRHDTTELPAVTSELSPVEQLDDRPPRRGRRRPGPAVLVGLGVVAAALIVSGFAAAGSFGRSDPNAGGGGATAPSSTSAPSSSAPSGSGSSSGSGSASSTDGSAQRPGAATAPSGAPAGPKGGAAAPGAAGGPAAKAGTPGKPGKAGAGGPAAGGPAAGGGPAGDPPAAP